LAVNRAPLPMDLPYDPSVLEIDSSVIPVIQMAISTPRSELETKRIGDRIVDDLLSLEGVSRVTVQGSRRAEISIEVDPKRLQEERISIGELSQLLQAWNINAPGGELELPEGQKVVRIVGEFKSVEDVANLVVRSNERGGGLRLGDIAAISEGLENPTRLYDVSGRTALSLIIQKKSDADIISVVDNVKEYSETITARYGNDVNIDLFQDMSRFTRMRLGVLTNNAMVGVFLVFIALIMFLRPSVALTTTIGLPIVFLLGLFLLDINGYTLNLISMMGFIMVLGMLVDDAIIVGENITYHMEQGMAPRQAAVTGAVELMGPVTATVLTTVVAFAPMMFMSGQIGKFIIAIPIVVITLLLISWLESFLILPSHVAFATNAAKHPPERKWLTWLENRYGKLLEHAIDHRGKAIILAAAAFFGSITLAVTSMSFQLFPPVAVDQYLVRVTAPAGTSIYEMRDYLRDVDKAVRHVATEENLENTIMGVGQIAMDAGDPNTQRGPRYGQIRVLYTPALLRPEHDALMDMRSLEKQLPKQFPKLDFAFTELRPGPPVGRPLEAQISATNVDESMRAARQLMMYLKGINGVTTVESGIDSGDEEIHVVLDRQLAAYAGVNLTTAASHVRAAVDGLRVSTIRRGTEEIDITIRLPSQEGVNQLEQLRGLLVPNQRGGLIPLSEISRFEDKKGFSTVRHKDALRIITVIANIDSDIITSFELNNKVAEEQAQWLSDLDGKVKVNYGGEAEKNTQSFRDLGISFGFAILGIFIILAIQFGNFRYPFVVMSAIPFGAIGIIISFFIHDLLWKPLPLSFFSMLGMVALTGVVVNSSLVLLVFIQRARETGMHWRDAIIQAGRRRLRAVLLTAATTIFGILPTAYGWGGLDPFVAPMALALSWGLIFATLITL
ncbi:MAG: efflux RND transporter permease subunit, partial [Gammaproteobacteria bacterium]|nr:efflux RND transporter permease subunit [Gammaproteobacteria bacterium]